MVVFSAKVSAQMAQICSGRFARSSTSAMAHGMDHGIGTLRHLVKLFAGDSVLPALRTIFSALHARGAEGSDAFC